MFTINTDELVVAIYTSGLCYTTEELQNYGPRVGKEECSKDCDYD